MVREGLVVSYGVSHLKLGPNLSILIFCPMSAYVHCFNLGMKYGCTHLIYRALGSCTVIILHE